VHCGIKKVECWSTEVHFMIITILYMQILEIWTEIFLCFVCKNFLQHVVCCTSKKEQKTFCESQSWQSLTKYLIYCTRICNNIMFWRAVWNPFRSCKHPLHVQDRLRLHAFCYSDNALSFTKILQNWFSFLWIGEKVMGNFLNANANSGIL
jgi:hypothetical protein